MNRYVMISSLCVAVLILGILCFVSVNYEGKRNTDVLVEEEPAATMELPKNSYFLSLSEGEVIVYKGDKKTIYERTGIKESVLPEYEITKLRKGYPVKNEQELYSILENFSS